jgi:hypothetical protein
VAVVARGGVVIAVVAGGGVVVAVVSGGIVVVVVAATLSGGGSSVADAAGAPTMNITATRTAARDLFIPRGSVDRTHI